MKHEVSVTVVDGRSRRFAREVKSASKLLLRLRGLKRETFDVYLVGEQFMRHNVLAFRATKNFPFPDVRGKYLGEIYLNPLFISRHHESLRFMLVHAFLHLLGYDHKKRRDRIQMEQEETKLLSIKELCHIL
jgi:rRNA maturation RNase YbeY